MDRPIVKPIRPPRPPEPLRPASVPPEVPLPDPHARGTTQHTSASPEPRRRIRPGSVSYTHLDVYKRQDVRHATAQAVQTVQTGIWIEEHGWLHRLFKSPDNASPKFRFPDLLGACVSLALRDPASQRRLVEYLVTQLTLRNPRTERRSCDIWAAQFLSLIHI